MIVHDPTSDLNRPYPFRVRRRHRETTESFIRRTLNANFENEVDERHLARLAKQAQPDMTKGQALMQLILRKAGVSEDCFVQPIERELTHPDGDTCKACGLGAGRRWMCRLCAAGDEIEQHPHLDSFSCKRHRIWTAPGTTIKDQTALTDAEFEAEQQFQRLRRKGLADATTLWELIHCVSDCDLDCDTERLPREHVPLAMKIWTELTHYEFSRDLFDPRNTYAHSHQLLSQMLESVPGVNPSMTRRVWHFIRPTMRAVREHIEFGADFRLKSPHDLPPRAVSEYAAARVGRPLEPFSRFLDTSVVTAAEWRGVITRRLCGVKEYAIDFVTADKRPGICPAGHPITGKAARSVLGEGRAGCLICAGSDVYELENSIAQTHPSLASWFDAQANPGLLIDGILAGSTKHLINWRCPKGHPFASTPKNLTAAGTCPVCTDRLLLRGVNSLVERAPQLAMEWHPTLNELSVDQVMVSLDKKAWWICAAGHPPYEAKVNLRFRLGRGCRVCAAGWWFKPGVNDMATLYPEFEPLWRPELNGGLQYSELNSGSSVPVTWRCANGHDYPRSPLTQRDGRACFYCAGKKVLPGFNDWATKYPLVMQEWDAEKNGIPASEAFGSKTKYWFTCRAASHSRFEYLHVRRASKGCCDCRKKDRRGFGLTRDEF